MCSPARPGRHPRATAAHLRDFPPVSDKELDAAGITSPQLRASYEACRRLNASHGKTYYLATLLLPAWKRPYVHALYGFARYADEIVDDLASTLTDAQKTDWLIGWSSTRCTAGTSRWTTSRRSSRACGWT